MPWPRWHWVCRRVSCGRQSSKEWCCIYSIRYPLVWQTLTSLTPSFVSPVLVDLSTIFLIERSILLPYRLLSVQHRRAFQQSESIYFPPDLNCARRSLYTNLPPG
ncbi:hypothetical protein H112_02048 [Trichophyton rubrum D6]|uniref:Uncharacterized protein n=3 Tax=Trichophyton TaxID=5550 RepID=A0A080WWL4_TRIRC|nr:uncharacterized protein TERG_12454 [Trichophyton rubrum CBS 118892]EZF25740.1 hypothetical protein H100_02046 [Trichophyton rubrum MR850]EZF44751.1 hypothetical protein H102_02041 [Trichophyton rubrum CBS 100081]EZF55422.1 hypothetical protein H103_02052 [Trichophyton rubrum CBS 288.86]EZF66040.1 hypothetical protein H104_02028 [Trichophyton rubrum CBS 289.86]EZF76644.1 hypothetical protein H105_02060 [Trichophyton soudanense CBS 452.61]EZF87271.1 hypothetical protein H110_02052 [Trichophy